MTRLWLGMLVGVVGVGMLAGCAGPWPARVLPQGSGVLEFRSLGDWDDVEASLLVAASQSQCALVGLSAEGGVWMGEVVSVHDDRAGVRVERDDANGSAGIVLTIEPSPSSDRGVFAAFGEHVVRRLRQLRGVRTAPLDGPER